MTRYWQDLEVGETFSTSDSLTLEREDILEFAAEFDPQPYHLDREAAEASIFGGLCASGWQVSAMMMRLLTDTFHQQEIALLGVASVQQMRGSLSHRNAADPAAFERESYIHVLESFTPPAGVRY